MAITTPLRARVGGLRGPGLAPGEAADLAAAVEAMAAGLAAQRTGVPRLLVEGDSIMASNHAAIFGTNFGMTQALGEITWARARYPYFELDQWPDAADLTHSSAGMNIAVAGSTTTNVLARIDQGLALAPDVACIAVGVNDINAGVAEATILANLQAIARAYSGIGCKVLLGTVRPVGASYHAEWADGGVRTLKRISLNASLIAWGASEPNVQIVDLDEGIGDGASPVRPLAGTTSDQLHLVRYGAFLGSGPWLTGLRRVIKPLQVDRPTGTNLISGGTFTGTGGTASTGVTGSVATGWVAAVNLGSATVVASKDASDRQVLTINPGSATDEQVQLSRQSGGAALQEGKWYKAIARVTLKASPYWRGITFIPWNGTTGLSAMADTANGAQLPLAADTEFLLETPVKQGPTGGTTASIFLRILFDGAAPGTIEAIVHEVHFQEVPDPRPLHGL